MVVGVVGGLKVRPIAFNLFYGKQMCDKADILKIYTSKKPHGVFFIISQEQNDKKIWTPKTNLVYREASQYHDLSVYLGFCQKVLSNKMTNIIKLLMSHKFLTAKPVKCSLFDPKVFVIDNCNLN